MHRSAWASLIIGLSASCCAITLMIIKETERQKNTLTIKEKLLELRLKAEETLAKQRLDRLLIGSKIQKSRSPEWYVNVNRLNVRGKPNKSAPIVGKLFRGTKVQLTKVGTWGQIAPGQFVHVSFLKPVKHVKKKRYQSDKQRYRKAKLRQKKKKKKSYMIAGRH